MIEQASLVIGECNWAVKEGSLLGYKLIEGKYYPRDMSVVRATTATRVNADGLVELVPYNYIPYSELFSDASWLKNDANIVGGFISPTGDANASKFSVTAANGIIQKTVSLIDLRTVSIYAKRGTHQYLMLGAYGGTNSYGNFDLENGVITSGTNTQIEDVGNGWYRCTCHSANGTTGGVQIFSSNSPIGPATTAGDIFIWGAQLVEGSLPKPYQKTETRLNIPRLDYSNGTCPSLLVEPQRTNLALYSEQFENSAWTKYQASITANAATAPNGVVTADKFYDNTNNDIHATYAPYLISSATTISGYVKSAEYSKISISNLSDGGDVIFDLSSASVVSSSGNFVNAQIESVNNGWFRVSATTNGTSGYKAIGFLLVNNSGSLSFVGTGTSGVYLWGAQLEAGSYPTSYIPTTTASVTRNADRISKTGISSLIGQTEGTLFVDAYITGKDTANGTTLFATDKVSSGALIRIIYTPSNALRFDVFDGSSFQCLISAGAFNVGDRVKVAGGYKNNDFVMFVNGTQIGTDTSGSVPTTDTANINTSIYGETNGGFIQAAALWKTRLTNAQLAELTTL